MPPTAETPRLKEWERAESELCKRSNYDFFLLAFPKVCKGRKLVLTWHLRAICDHLQALAEGQIQNLLINVPPRHMKSLLVSVFWAAWLWIRNPSLQLLFASKAQGIALRDNRRTRQLIESPWFQARWSVQMVKDQNAKGLYINTDGGQRQATSSNSEALGIDADILVGDDFHGLNDSADEIDKVVEWIEDTFWGRANDDWSPRLVIGQRVRGNDISGHIIAGKYGGDWTCLILPMEHEPARHCRTGVKSEGYPNGFSDPRIVAGELLAPGRYSQEKVDKFRETKPGTHARINQQNPTPREGGIFKRAWLRRDTHRLDVAKVTRFGTSCDTPFRKGKATDFYVHQLIAEVETFAHGLRATKFIPIAQKRGRKSYAEMETSYAQALIEWQSWKGIRLYKNLVEAKASGDAIISKLGAVATIVPFEPGSNSKEQRFETAAPTFQAGHVSFPAEGFELVLSDGSIMYPDTSWVDGCIEEIATAETADHDDQADTITQYILDAANGTPEPAGSTFEEAPRVDVYAPERAGRLFR
jgi:phage terminase large subunit-like protein